MKPIISVLMPVYNTKPEYLKGAIETILHQTFTDFEFIILDDGSEPYVGKLVNSYCDDRIRYIYKNNTGIADTLNFGLDLSRGKYIARMDADDLAVPTRFEVQLKFLQDNPSVSAVGAWIMKFQEAYGLERFPIHLTYKDFLRCCAISHPAIMFSKKDFEKYNLRYDPSYSCEDYELWTRAIRVLKFVNIPKVLLYYRINDQSITYNKQMILQKDAKRTKDNLIQYVKETYNEEYTKKEELELDYKYRYNINFFGKHIKLTRLNRNIAVVNLKGKSGSIGDQMFQFAYGKVLELTYGLDVRYDDSFYAGQYTGLAPECYPYYLCYFPNLELKLAAGNCIERIKRDYWIKIKNHLFKHTRNKGYYKEVIKDDTLFKEYEPQLREIFKFAKITNERSLAVLDKINNCENSVFLDCDDHVHCKGQYNQAIGVMIFKLHNPTFFVFNDYKGIFKGKEGFVEVTPEDYPDEYTKLHLMSKCKHAIRASNASSWWGSWLIENKNKISVPIASPHQEENTDDEFKQLVKTVHQLNTN